MIRVAVRSLWVSETDSWFVWKFQSSNPKNRGDQSQDSLQVGPTLAGKNIFSWDNSRGCPCCRGGSSEVQREKKDKAVRLDEFHSQFAGQRLFQNIFVTVFLTGCVYPNSWLPPLRDRGSSNCKPLSAEGEEENEEKEKQKEKGQEEGQKPEGWHPCWFQESFIPSISEFLSPPVGWWLSIGTSGRPSENAKWKAPARWKGHVEP